MFKASIITGLAVASAKSVTLPNGQEVKLENVVPRGSSDEHLFTLKERLDNIKAGKGLFHYDKEAKTDKVATLKPHATKFGEKKNRSLRAGGNSYLQFYVHEDRDCSRKKPAVEVNMLLETCIVAQSCEGEASIIRHYDENRAVVTELIYPNDDCDGNPMFATSIGGLHYEDFPQDTCQHGYSWTVGNGVPRFESAVFDFYNNHDQCHDGRYPVESLVFNNGACYNAFNNGPPPAVPDGQDPYYSIGLQIKLGECHKTGVFEFQISPSNYDGAPCGYGPVYGEPIWNFKCERSESFFGLYGGFDSLNGEVNPITRRQSGYCVTDHK